MAGSLTGGIDAVPIALDGAGEILAYGLDKLITTASDAPMVEETAARIVGDPEVTKQRISAAGNGNAPGFEASVSARMAWATEHAEARVLPTAFKPGLPTTFSCTRDETPDSQRLL